MKAWISERTVLSFSVSPFEVRAVSIQMTTCAMSSGLSPRVVMAGLPIRKPLGRKGGRGSFAILLQFAVMPMESRMFCASRPSMLRLVIMSIWRRWLSVPFVTSL